MVEASVSAGRQTRETLLVDDVDDLDA